MSNQNSAIDDNRRHTLMGVTDNVAAELRRLLVDPITGALKCTAVLSISGLTVSGGGTGLASLTPYAVLTGGTTATDAMQQVSGLGNANQVLTSNGAGALPTWQDVAASSGATRALDNLASVAINTALLPNAAGTLDFGSTTLPWANIWLSGASGTPGTNQFKITGASTGGLRTITLPNASITVNASADISGTTLASNVVSSSLTSVGTIGTGVWQGTTIKANYLQAAAADLGAADVNINLGNTNGAYNTNLTIDGIFQALGIGVTGTRIATGFFTDLTVTNAIAGSVTGNAGTVTNGIYTTSPVTALAAATGADKDKYVHSNASTGALEWSAVAGGSGLKSSAIGQFAMTTANNSTTNYAHGLGATPTWVRITGYVVVAGVTCGSNGIWLTGNVQNCIGFNQSDATAHSLILDEGSGAYQVFDITVDGTNIIVTNLKGGSPTGTAVLLFEAGT